ncbi:MAG TPA: hypothetical protein VFX84_02790 [Candidatus Saccharimonadales bacterium]|nr:hypothetical protein [Candidatus Saccharimonadales bacterium]
MAGDRIRVHATLTNTSRDALQLWGSQLIGTGGTFSSGVILDSGSTTNFYFDIPAPSTVQNYGFSYYPNYPGPGGGGRIWGGTCSGSVPVYEPFTLVPHATLNYPGTKEYTRDITYSTYIQNNSSQHVAAPTTSKFTYTPYASGVGCPSNGPVNTNGPYGPGGPNYTISPTVCKPATYEAGDLYCSKIDLTGYNQGYIGPGGPSDIRGAKLNQSFAGSEQCVKIINEPYFKVYGTGLSAGGDFSTNGDGQCIGGGLLAGYTDNADPIARGTGSQLSALALIKITGVASAQKSYPTSSPAGTALTFANTKSGDISSSLDSPSLGGNFDPGGSHCLTDQKAPSGATVHSGNYTVGAKSNVSNNQSVFVNGNVRITGNVTYINSWNIDSAPSFVLRATGNIYIDPGVTRLDGTYISNKTIYTCSNNSFSPKPASAMHNGCKNQLVFNGSVVAKKINLMRTFGSLRDERPIGAVPAGSQIGFKWSSAGPITGMKCTRIDEPSDPDTWHDNYLCIPSSSSLQLAWTHHSDNTGSGSTNIGSGVASLGYIKSHGYPHCTKWDVPSDYSHTWQDNYLCTNQDKGLSFRATPDASKYCLTKIIESADPQGQWKSGYYLCENKAAPAVLGGTPAAPACSNKGAQLITSTCAAEIFNFSPELYLSTPAIQLPNNGAVQYDAVTSLPPVL